MWKIQTNEPIEPLATIPMDVFTSTHVIGNSCPVHIAMGVEPWPEQTKQKQLTDYQDIFISQKV